MKKAAPAPLSGVFHDSNARVAVVSTKESNIGESTAVVVGLGLNAPPDANQKIQRSPSKQKSLSRKRTKSLGNLRLRSQADKELVPPRPPNAWILYRSTKFKEFKARQELTPSPMMSTPPLSASPGSTISSNTHTAVQAEVSRIISDMWKSEKEEVKLSFVRLAEEKKCQHMEMFPDYKYRPKRQYGSAQSAIKSKANNEEGVKSESIASPTVKAVGAAKKRPKAISRAHTFSIDTSQPSSTEASDGVNLSESPSSGPYTPFTAILEMKGASSPMQEDSEKLLESGAQLVEEMQQNDWLRAIATSTEEGEIEPLSTTSSSFTPFATGEVYSVPTWDSESPRITASASAPLSRLIWETASTGPAEPSSALSWHSSDPVPWDCSELIETLDDFAPSDMCTPNLSTPDYSATSSPFHPYSNRGAATEAMSTSSLYLGIPVTAPVQREDLQSPFMFNGHTDDDQNRTRSVSLHSVFQEQYFSRYQDAPAAIATTISGITAAAAPLRPESHSSVDLHSSFSPDNDDRGRMMWSSSSPQLLQKSLSSRSFLPSQSVPTHEYQQQHQQQQHHYPSGDGGLHRCGSDWLQTPVRSNAPLLPSPHHQHLDDGRSRSTEYSYHQAVQPQIGFATLGPAPQQYNHQQQHPFHQGAHHNAPFSQQQQQQQQQQAYYHPRSASQQDDYHNQQEFLHHLHRLARDDVATSRP